MLLTVMALPLAWAGYWVNLAAARKTFLLTTDVFAEMGDSAIAPNNFPASLRLVGDRWVFAMTLGDRKDEEAARRLFPEATIVANPELYRERIRPWASRP
jgi:hypothetical protein